MEFLKNYISSPTHRWWVDNVWRPSWTRFLSLIYGIPSALAAAWLWLFNASQDNKLQELLDKVHVPDWVPFMLAIVGLLHYVAHGRED